MEEAASAAGQKYLLTFFGKNADVTDKEDQEVQPLQQSIMLSVTERPESDTSVEGNQDEDDITDGRRSPQGTSTSADAQGSCWYKGKKLDINWLLLSEDCLKVTREVRDKRQRPVVKCSLRSEYELEVRKFANNGRIPLASGICVDGKDKLGCRPFIITCS